MEVWQIILSIWFGISFIIAPIIRGSLGKRDKAWEEYASNLSNWDTGYEGEYFPIGCGVVIATIVLLPGFLAVAMWDWVLCLVPSNISRKIRHSRAFKEALKRLPPFERECYSKILELREHRRELQNVLVDQENDGDPDTPTKETLRQINERLKQIERAENELWKHVSTLPMSDLPVHQRLEKAKASVEQADQLLETANSPEVQLLRSGGSVSPEELKEARAELNR